ncbi:MAG TPA: hypothetical protein P5314_04330 [Tetrasphaera sp.]|nr:hypothetical protein [Tetrasphaera sp.]
MSDKSQNLVMQWRPVTGRDGRTRMEARWVTPAADRHPAQDRRAA